MFRQTQPIIGTQDVLRARRFYLEKLGFEVAFWDRNDPPNYVGFRRDGVEVHMQFQYPHEMGTLRLRFLVDDPDALAAEYAARGVEITNPLRDTPWGTPEFALHDPDHNSFTFYRDLTPSEKARRQA